MSLAGINSRGWLPNVQWPFTCCPATHCDFHKQPLSYANCLCTGIKRLLPWDLTQLNLPGCNQVQSSPIHDISEHDGKHLLQSFCYLSKSRFVDRISYCSLLYSSTIFVLCPIANLVQLKSKRVRTNDSNTAHSYACHQFAVP